MIAAKTVKKENHNTSLETKLGKSFNFKTLMSDKKISCLFEVQIEKNLLFQKMLIPKRWYLHLLGDQNLAKLWILIKNVNF